MSPRLLPLLLGAALAAAGCISLPQDDPSATGGGADAPAGTTGGRMSAKESVDETVAPCAEGLFSEDGAFCATRTVRVSGELSGFETLDVALSTFNGDVVAIAGPEGEWGLVATLTARGATSAEARARLDDIAFAWAHESDAGHFVDVEAKMATRTTDGHGARLEATLPASVVYTLVATTSNGDVEAKGLRTSALALRTSNGNLRADGQVEQASFATSNGDIDLSLVPTGHGRLRADSSNGGIRLALPEAPAYGYDVEGQTSNGEVEILLQDGDLGDCPEGSQYYTPPCNHRTFRTSNFATRDVQSHVGLATSNGDISVRRA